MFILTLAERSVGTFQKNMAVISIYLFLFVAIVMFVRFLFFIRAEDKQEDEKNKRLAKYTDSYCELVKKNSENLDMLASYLFLFPFYHPKTQALLVKAETYTREMLALLDNAPKEWGDEDFIDIDTRRDKLLKDLGKFKKLILIKEN